MVNDVNNNIIENNSMWDGFTVTKVSVERSQTEDKTYSADITFKASDRYAEFTGTGYVEYNKYDGNNWMLDDCTLYLKDTDIKVMPEDSFFETDIQENTLQYFKEDRFRVSKNSGVNIVSIESAENDGDGGVSVKVHWNTYDKYVSADLNSVVNYRYLRGEWTFTSVTDSICESFDFNGVAGHTLSGTVFQVSGNYTVSLYVNEINADHITFTYEGDEYTYYYNAKMNNYNQDDTEGETCEQLACERLSDYNTSIITYSCDGTTDLLFTSIDIFTDDMSANISYGWDSTILYFK